MTTVIDTHRVTPPPDSVAEQSLPLIFFDITWLHFHPMLQLLFYEIPCSNPHFFLETIVPKLKQSLSLTLKHFFPLSGNVVYPLSPEEMPTLRYRSGDAVPLTIAESGDDFDDLVENNQAQAAEKFYSLIPQLPPIVEESDRKLFQVLAVQLTLFPGRGVCIGISTHHCISDAPSFMAFLARWASISKNGGDDGESPPVFDRSLINYPLKLDSIYWSNFRKIPLQTRHPSPPTNRVRSIYVFSKSKIEKLKESIKSKVPSLVRLSSFVAIAAYIWSTMAKALRSDENEAESKNENDDEPAFFLIPIDLRPRLDPPVPANYSGNCLSYALPKVRLRDLAGDEGLFVAAEAMAAEIKSRTGDKKILETVEERLPEIREAVQKSFFSVAGSTQLDLYGWDFGWGKARKQEILSIDGEKYAMTLCKSRDFEGGFEVGLSLPREKTEAFHAYFSKEMK